MPIDLTKRATHRRLATIGDIIHAPSCWGRSPSWIVGSLIARLPDFAAACSDLDRSFQYLHFCSGLQMVDHFQSLDALSRRKIIAGAFASAILTPSYAAAPTGTVSIIDLYGGDSIEPERAKGSGVVAIIHKATEGSDFRDRKYSKRRAAAKQLGLLWGSFHFSNDSNTSQQVANYLSHAEIAREDLICLDFEHNKGQEMSLGQAHEFISMIHAKVGRYPVLYGGAWLREQVGGREDPIFAKCPLWYRRYAPLPKAIPKKIWPTYTLWQYTDGNADYGGPPRSVNGLACDRNLFDGTVDELRRSWPFT